MVRALVILLLGIAGAGYLTIQGLADVAIGNASKATPTTMTYESFVSAPPEPGTVVEITGVFVQANSVDDLNTKNELTAAYTGIAPANVVTSPATNMGAAAAGGPPGILAAAIGVDRGGFARIAQSDTVTGLVLDPKTRFDAELESLIASSFPDLDMNGGPRLRIGLQDTTNTGYLKLGAAVALVVLPLVNLLLTAKKGGAGKATEAS